VYRPSTLEVTLRRQEQLRDAEQRRWAATVRRTDRRSNRITRALGLRGSLAV
jgi:hypothetical protein